MKKKKSLFLWADNSPYTVHIDLVCKKFFDNMYFEGNYMGTQIVYGDDSAKKQKFDVNHAIAYGLNNLYEGITICHPVNIHKDF